MAFRDLFLPKIAHSNPEVRKKAVKDEKDKALLQRVIENDQDPEVVKTAKKRIEGASPPKKGIMMLNGLSCRGKVPGGWNRKKSVAWRL